MKSEILTNFISKYAVGDIISKDVIWEFSENMLTANFMTNDSTCCGSVTMFGDDFNQFNGIKFPFDKHLKMFQFLEKNGDCKFFHDGSTVNIVNDIGKLILCDAEPSNVKLPPDLKIIMPDKFDIHIKITEEFVDKFLKFRYLGIDNGLFSIRCVDNGCELFIGTDGSGVEIQLETTKFGKIEPQFYNINIFTDALSANRGVETEFLVSTDGIAVLEFKTADYHAEYIFLAEAKHDSEKFNISYPKIDINEVVKVFDVPPYPCASVSFQSRFVKVDWAETHYDLELFKTARTFKYYNINVQERPEYLKHVIEDALGNKAILELNEKNEVIAFHRFEDDLKSNLHRLAILIMRRFDGAFFLAEDDDLELEEYGVFIHSMQDILENGNGYSPLIDNDSILYMSKKLSYYKNINYLSINMDILFKNMMENNLDNIEDAIDNFFSPYNDWVSDYIEYYMEFCDKDDVELEYDYVC